MGNFHQESKYQDACTQYIQELQERVQWVGVLDLEIVAQAHRAGALWVRDTFDSKIDNPEQVQSSANNTPTTGKDTAL